jgi:hypothetical protein
VLAIMSNVTLQNGCSDEHDMHGTGGAVHVATGGTFTVTSSTFSGNSGNSGGAVCTMLHQVAPPP